MKKVIKVVGAAAVVAGVFAIGTQMFNPAPVVSKGAVYGGKMYIAGHGGHIAVADVQIDPTADKPITVTNLDRIEIGTPKSPPLPRRAHRPDEPRPALLQHLQARRRGRRQQGQAALRLGRPQGREGDQGRRLGPRCARDRGRRLHGRQLLRLRPEQGLLLPGHDGHGRLHRRRREDDDDAEAPRLRRLARRQDRLPVHARQHLAGHEELPARGQQGHGHPQGRLGHHRRAGALPARRRLPREGRAQGRQAGDDRRRQPEEHDHLPPVLHPGRQVHPAVGERPVLRDRRRRRSRSSPRRTARTA